MIGKVEAPHRPGSTAHRSADASWPDVDTTMLTAVRFRSRAVGCRRTVPYVFCCFVVSACPVRSCFGCSDPDHTSWPALYDAVSFGFGDAASPADAPVFDEAHAPAAHAIIPTSPERIDGMSPAVGVSKSRVLEC